MGDNSVDWMSVLKAVSDNELYMNILFGDMKDETPQEMEGATMINQAANPEEMVQDQETNLTLAAPLQNLQVPEFGPSSSSSIVFQESTTTVQNKIINGGSLLNPLGFPYQPALVQPPSSATVELENGGQSSSSLGLPQNTHGGEKKLIVYRKRGRKKEEEAGEADDAEQRKELTRIKNRITAARSRAKKQMEEDMETKKQDMAEKAALKRTSSSGI
ncbi:hypothetical protein SLEP1_g43263 [Rubroshorea leprosula]|uniref:BZIP domain-containing protein n=1 Tax=Rubroshorea leprosula TaxID=152421 RepID=A0AAV5LDG9_9ROSI|nr:hypothetical protein SLEP1_g43263 [Rubroshorea leprosula]